jgi:hypothetical protein
MAPEPQPHRVDPKAVIRLYDSGKFPSQVAVDLGCSLHEVLDILERRRKAAEPQEQARLTAR